MNKSRLSILVEAAVMIGLAVILSEVRLFKMPYGGSVTAGSMVPLLLIGLRHGPYWGVVAGVAAGLLNYIVDPYFVHWAQILLDYPVAFGMLGLAGLAAGRSWTAGAWLGSVALVGRFAAHLLSGAIFFAEYAPEGQSPWLYSALYNGAYMLPELIISAVLLMVLLPALHRALPATVQTRQSA